MLHANSVTNCDNTSDKLTVTDQTETENQSALDFGSPLKTPTLKINDEIIVSQFVLLPVTVIIKDDQRSCN